MTKEEHTELTATIDEMSVACHQLRRTGFGGGTNMRILVGLLSDLQKLKSAINDDLVRYPNMKAMPK